MNNYKEWLKKHKRPNTIKRYVKIAQDFQQWYEATNETFNPELVSDQDLQNWKRYLMEEASYSTKKERKKYSVSSINNYIQGIKVYFDFLKETGMIRVNPADSLKSVDVEKEEEKPRWLDHDEKDRLLLHIDNPVLRKKNPWRFFRNRAICYTMLYAGLRVHEVVNLEVDDLRFQEGILMVRGERGGRSVPMVDPLADALKVWLHLRGLTKTHACFTSQRGGPITEDGITYLFIQLREKTGIPDLSPHVLRHTYARDLAERGESLQTIARLLGNNNINYTRQYRRDL